MGRKIKPHSQKKPWSELTEEERNAIRESWKHTLPEEFDVYCLGDYEINALINIHGNFYCTGDIIVKGFGSTMYIAGDCIADGDIDVWDMFIRGSCFVRHNIDCCTLDVGGFLDCYDVESHATEISASDFVCRYIEEEI